MKDRQRDDWMDDEILSEDKTSSGDDRVSFLEEVDEWICSQM